MADFQPRDVRQILALANSACFAFHFVDSVGASVISDFGAKLPYDPIAWLPTLSPACCHAVPKVCYWWCGYTFPSGVSTR